MNTHTDTRTQLTELAIVITTQVAEMLIHASKNMPLDHRTRIDQMIQENLPDVVLNTLFSTQVLHSAQGVDHLRQNLDHYSHQITQMLINNQS